MVERYIPKPRVERYIPKPRIEIYCAYNTITRMCYVGKTASGIKRRIKEHLKPGANKRFFQRALAKYGITVFRLGVIDVASSDKLANQKERYWIRKLNCKAPNGYNLTAGGEGTFDPAPETRRRMSKAAKTWMNSPEGKVIQSEVQKNRYLNDPEAREQLIKQGYTGLWETDRGYMLEICRAGNLVANEKRWADPEAHIYFSQHATERQTCPILRKNMSVKAKKRLEDPKEREKISVGLTAYLATEEGFQARSIAMYKAWETRRRNKALCVSGNATVTGTTALDRVQPTFGLIK